MKKTKEECLLMNGVMAYDLGKVEKQVMKAMDDYADDAVSGRSELLLAFLRYLDENDKGAWVVHQGIVADFLRKQ